jgi:hypothetical protein
VTAIAGFVHKGSVWIGGDSAGVADYDLHIRADQKVFVNGEFGFGFTSSLSHQKGRKAKTSTNTWSRRLWMPCANA